MANKNSNDAANQAGNQQRADARQAAGGPPADAPSHHSLDQNGTGYTPEEASQETAERAGQNRQSATGGAAAGHYTGGAAAARDGGFVKASPESMVGPAGAAQTSRSAGQAGGIEPGTMGGAAGGGAPGTSRDESSED